MQRRPKGSPPSKRRKVPYDQSPKRGSSYTKSNAAIALMSKYQPAGASEKKYIDTTVTSAFQATTVTTWSVLLLNGVAQGLTQNARVGNKIQMKSLQLRLSGPVTNTGNMRVRVIYDKACSGSTPAAGGIILELDEFSALVEKATAGRFITLCDELVTVDNTNELMLYSKYLKFDLPTIYTIDGATVAAINAGGLFLMINHAGATFTSNAVASYARVRFTDE